MQLLRTECRQNKTNEKFPFDKMKAEHYDLQVLSFKSTQKKRAWGVGNITDLAEVGLETTLLVA